MLERLRYEVTSIVVLLFITAAAMVFFLNTPISSEQIQGTIIRSSIPPASKRLATILTYIALENGRTVTVSLPPGAALPQDGSHVNVTRYKKRLFGDSFGLKQQKKREVSLAP